VEPPHTRPEEYRERRRRLGTRLGADALVLGGGRLRTRSADTEYRFRPDSDFHYLTGLAEPDAVLVLRPGRTPELTMFVRPRDRQAEVWSGRRPGPEGAVAQHGADEAHAIDELTRRLPTLLDGCPRVHLPLGRDARLDRAVLDAIDRLRKRNRWGETPPESVVDARVTIGEDRMVKDGAALRSLRFAVGLSAQAHLDAMRRVAPGMHEYEVEARLQWLFRRAGSEGPAYGCIVAGGDNATILHYIDNTAPLRDGTLLLVDAGCEWELFAGDITRTYPVGGRFSPAQRDLYAVVLAANLAGIAAAVPGGDIDAIHAGCLRILCDGLIQLRLATGSVDELIETRRYERFYMHRTSHWLGADVHDAGKYTLDRRPRPLEPGFVLTVEPGLYVAADDAEAPAELRGTGIRIEDDVLVTPQGPEVLSRDAPKTVDELEAIVGSAAGELE
jgi:Xaa-Pro aminopeptidase